MKTEDEYLEKWLRLILGSLCVFTGAIILAFVLWILWPLVSSGDPVALRSIASALPLEKVPQALQTPHGSVVLPDGFMATTSLFITILILGIVLSIGKSFLSAGVSLINPDMRKILGELKNKLGR